MLRISQQFTTSKAHEKRELLFGVKSFQKVYGIIAADVAQQNSPVAVGMQIR